MKDGSLMERGGEREGIIRMVIALEHADGTIDADVLFRDIRMFPSDSGFRKPTKAVFLHVFREQSRLLEMDERMALKALTRLIPTIEGRKRALEMVSRIILSEKPLSEKQKIMLARLRKILGLQYIYLEKFRPRRKFRGKFDRPY